jgi:Uma2 family endonuclease
MKVRVDVAEAYFYPDLSGLCGEFEFHDGRDDSCRNPQFIIEIVSDRTESYDRGEKFFHCQTLPSPKEYLLVSQRKKLAQIYRKQGDHWIYRLLGDDDAVPKLESVGY